MAHGQSHETKGKRARKWLLLVLFAAMALTAYVSIFFKISAG